MQINVVTCHRSPNYLESTMESLRQSDWWRETTSPVHLLVGSDRMDYVRRYVGHPRITVVPWHMEKFEPRCSYNVNYSRTLLYGADGAERVVIEDDIEFCRTWYKQLQPAITAVRADRKTTPNPERFIISLYACYDLAPLPNAAARYYPHGKFYGAQGLYFPPYVNEALAGYISEKQNYQRHFGDILINEWCGLNGDCLYATARSVVQHRGLVSGASCPFHAAGDFSPD